MATGAGQFYSYGPGKALSAEVRKAVVDHLSLGYGVREVAELAGISKSSVGNIWKHFLTYGTTQPFTNGGALPSKMTEDVLEVMEVWKIQKPSMFANEIRDRLLSEDVCDVNTVPSVRTIQKAIHDRLGMTHKKISQQAAEKFTSANQHWTDEFLDFMSHQNPKLFTFSMSLALHSLQVTESMVAVIEGAVQWRCNVAHPTQTIPSTCCIAYVALITPMLYQELQIPKKCYRFLLKL